MGEETSLRMTRVFNAPRDLVFSAWVEVEQMKRWFCPYDHWTLDITNDPRIDGAYRIVMKNPDTKENHIVRGIYREIRAPERLVFTWQSETIPGFPETLVTVELRDLGGKTELTLTHEALPTPELRDRHTHGWNLCLERLGKAL
jgi:uncharacterized protein YndB with AHSA1/START domain